MDIHQFIELREDRDWNDTEMASFRRRGYHISWFSTTTEVPKNANPVSVSKIPPCLIAGFPKGAITKAWRTPAQKGLSHYYLQDRDGDIQSVS